MPSRELFDQVDVIGGFEIPLDANEAGVGWELGEESGFTEEAGGDERVVGVESGVFEGVLKVEDRLALGWRRKKVEFSLPRHPSGHGP